MVSIDGSSIIISNIKIDELAIVTRETASMALPPSSSATIDIPASSAISTPASSGTETPTSSTNDSPASSSSVAQQDTPASSAQQVVTDGNLTISGSLTQTVAKNAKTTEVKFSGVENVTRMSWNAWWLEEPKQSGDTYTIPASTVPEHFQPDDGNTVTEFFKINGKDYEFKITISGSNTQPASSSSQQQAKSSSSQQAKSSSSQQPKSSSSVVQSSSSVVKSSSSSQVVTTGCPAIKTKGGASGSGFASRYWDGCKPSCSWKNNAGSAGPAKQCSANGKTENTNYDEQSVCSGGGAATCTSQIPFTIDGCDNIGFAFAAVPASNGGQCGKCFQLTFTGKGKYETKQNHKALAGKKLIVMVTNIGADVNQGQFDVMIPGGGVGLYNGTSGYGWGAQGAQYGGLLSDCETEVGYNASNLLEKRKSCLTEKCNKTFASDATAKQGCLFLANFMEAAGNPNHDYVEVECPEVLKQKY
ncbi:MAG: glycosyl hydrolase family 5 [Fibrobacter sp.]|nr:glycosyl hydrolase family 5 [Fibrobacter sp.]